MASKRRRRRRECTNKRRFGSYAGALPTLRRMQREGYKRIVIYECDFCQGYHIGRQRLRMYRKRT